MAGHFRFRFISSQWRLSSLVQHRTFQSYCLVYLLVATMPVLLGLIKCYVSHTPWLPQALNYLPNFVTVSLLPPGCCKIICCRMRIVSLWTPLCHTFPSRVSSRRAQRLWYAYIFILIIYNSIMHLLYIFFGTKRIKSNMTTSSINIIYYIFYLKDIHIYFRCTNLSIVFIYMQLYIIE